MVGKQGLPAVPEGSGPWKLGGDPRGQHAERSTERKHRSPQDQSPASIRFACAARLGRFFCQNTFPVDRALPCVSSSLCAPLTTVSVDPNIPLCHHASPAALADSAPSSAPQYCPNPRRPCVQEDWLQGRAWRTRTGQKT